MQHPLTPSERQSLKGRAHRLDPVVMVGADGLTPAVLAEIDRALTAHELIKIRAASADGATRDRFLAEICAATDSSPVQHIGKILVIYRALPPAPAPPPPKPAPARQRRPPPRPSRGATRQAKLRSR